MMNTFMATIFTVDDVCHSIFHLFKGIILSDYDGVSVMMINSFSGTIENRSYHTTLFNIPGFLPNITVWLVILLQTEILFANIGYISKKECPQQRFGRKPLKILCWRKGR